MAGTTKTLQAWTWPRVEEIICHFWHCYKRHQGLFLSPSLSFSSESQLPCCKNSPMEEARNWHLPTNTWVNLEVDPTALLTLYLTATCRRPWAGTSLVSNSQISDLQKLYENISICFKLLQFWDNSLNRNRSLIQLLKSKTHKFLQTYRIKRAELSLNSKTKISKLYLTPDI